MDERAFDALTRNAGALSRRRSLWLLGGAGLAATLAGPSTATADKKSEKKCKKEKKQCRKGIQEFCEGNTNCLDSFLPCCASCKVQAGVRCVLNVD